MDTEIRVSTESRPWRRKFSRRSCRDSNPRPFNRESGALTTELSPPSYGHNARVNLFMGPAVKGYRLSQRTASLRVPFVSGLSLEKCFMDSPVVTSLLTRLPILMQETLIPPPSLGISVHARTSAPDSNSTLNKSCTSALNKSSTSALNKSSNERMNNVSDLLNFAPQLSQSVVVVVAAAGTVADQWGDCAWSTCPTSHGLCLPPAPSSKLCQHWLRH